MRQRASLCTNVHRVCAHEREVKIESVTSTLCSTFWTRRELGDREAGGKGGRPEHFDGPTEGHHCPCLAVFQ